MTTLTANEKLIMELMVLRDNKIMSLPKSTQHTAYLTTVNFINNIHGFYKNKEEAKE